MADQISLLCTVFTEICVPGIMIDLHSETIRIDSKNNPITSKGSNFCHACWSNIGNGKGGKSIFTGLQSKKCLRGKNGVTILFEVSAAATLCYTQSCTRLILST